MSEVQNGVRHAVDKLFARFPKAEVVEELARVVKRESAPVAAVAAKPEPEPEAEVEAELPPIETPSRGTGRKK